MHVCVLGAGIVGLSTAYALRKQGFEVTVVDQGEAGSGASGGNGAQLSYSYVQPLADPSVWPQLPYLLLSPQSPLKVRPQWDVQQWRWGIDFLRACNRTTSEQTTAQLLLLAAQSRAGFETMLQQEKLACDFSATGKLVLYSTPQSFAKAQRQLDTQRAWGCVQEAVSAQRCVDLEPALQHYQSRIAGAIYTPSECAADCLKVCQGLQQVLLAAGVQFVMGATVQGFDQRQGQVHAVRTSAGTLVADVFVCAMGSASRHWAQALGCKLPVYPLKGYSITLDLGDRTEGSPRVNVTDAERKVVFARIGQRLRVAGMAELVGDDAGISPARIASLQQTLREVFPACQQDGDIHPWAGMRPATPTGLPIVGRLPGAPSNMVFNTGHGSLGFTLAFGTAAQVVALLSP
jgi:D-amino-acid dehydrogenase